MELIVADKVKLISPEADLIRGHVYTHTYAYKFVRWARVSGTDDDIGFLCSCESQGLCIHAAAVLFQGQLTPSTEHRQVRRWLSVLRTLAPEEDEREVLWVLAFRSGGWRSKACLSGAFVRKRPDGLLHARSARYLGQGGASVDRSTFRALSHEDYSAQRSGEFALDRRNVEDVLSRLARAGRLRLDAVTGPALRLGEPRQGNLVWQREAAESERLVIGVKGPPISLVETIPPWYVDREAGLCGPIEIGLAEWQLEQVYDAPLVTPSAAELVARSVIEEGVTWLPLPAAVTVSEDAPPMVGKRLRFTRPEASTDEFEALLDFDYGDNRVTSTTAGEAFVWYQGNELHRVQRNKDDENRAIAILEDFGLRRKPGDRLRFEVQGEDTFLKWLTLPAEIETRLGAYGWSVEAESDFPRLAAVSSPLACTLSESGHEPGWFEVALGVEIGGRVVDAMGAILVALATPSVREKLQGGESDSAVLYVDVHPHGYIPIDLGRARALYAAFAEIGGPLQTRPRVGRTDLALLPLLEGSGFTVHGADGIRALASEIEAAHQMQLEGLPPTLDNALRGYQREGVRFLQAMSRCGLGALLADDMGLGKSIQLLAHLALEKSSGRAKHPSLLIVPTSVITKWQAENEKFGAGLRIVPLVGADRSAAMARLDDCDVALTSFELLVRDEKQLLAREWHVACLDEAHRVRNAATKTARTAFRIKAHQRIGLTGTPMQNNLGDVWSLYSFIAPGLLRSEAWFRKHVRNPIERENDQARWSTLRRQIKPFTLRRTRAEVMNELPPLTVYDRPVVLKGRQRDLYEAVRVKMLARVKASLDAGGLERSRVLVLDALLHLRQLCTDPRLYKGPVSGDIESAKLEAFSELLHELLDEDHRVLVYSQWTELLDLLKLTLANLDIKWAEVRGDVQGRAREAQLAEFREGRVRVMLNSLKAAGEALDLYEADTVILYEPWWNPFAEDQAIARAHRSGQVRPVFVYRLSVTDSVEERMLRLQLTKRGLFDALIEGAPSELRALTREDVEMLFEPMSERTVG